MIIKINLLFKYLKDFLAPDEILQVGELCSIGLAGRNRAVQGDLTMFTATWKKNARLLAKGGKKFLDYKRDLLTGDRIAEIESRRADLLKAIKANDRGKTEEASKQLKDRKSVV